MLIADVNPANCEAIHHLKILAVPFNPPKQVAAWLRLACKSASEHTERARGGRAVESERAHCPSERERAREREAAFALARKVSMASCAQM